MSLSNYKHECILHEPICIVWVKNYFPCGVTKNGEIVLGSLELLNIRKRSGFIQWCKISRKTPIKFEAMPKHPGKEKCYLALKCYDV